MSGGAVMMRLLLFVALTVVVSGGCRKVMDSPEPAGGGNQGGGSGFGAEQAVRGAVTREQLLEALGQIRLFIDNAGVDGNMPSPETTLATLQREAPKYAKLVTDGKIVLNPATTREEVWAYAQLPQGNYAVAVASGVEQMDQASLNQRLGR
jgi:hypothetical protein